jgi:hypothetical protein
MRQPFIGESLDVKPQPIVLDGRNGKTHPIVDGKLVPIVLGEPDGKLLPIVVVDRFPSFPELTDPQSPLDPDSKPIGDESFVENGETAKQSQTTGIKINNKRTKDSAKRIKPSSKPKKPRSASEIASPLLAPEVRAKSLATRRRNAAQKKKNKAKNKKARAERALANGGRVSKTGRIYSADSITKKSTAMREVTSRRIEDELHNGILITRNLGSSDKYRFRSPTEDLLFEFLTRQHDQPGNRSFPYTHLFYPERDYPEDSQDWTVTPEGLLSATVRDFDIYFENNGGDLCYQYQCKGLTCFFYNLRKALQHRVSKKTSKTFYLNVRKDLFSLVVRDSVNSFICQYCEGIENEIPRETFYVSLTSVRHRIHNNYLLDAVDVWDLLVAESNHFWKYWYSFFKTAFPIEHKIHFRANELFKQSRASYLNPQPPNFTSSKEIALQYGQFLIQAKTENNYSDSESGLHSQWEAAHERGWKALKEKLPPAFSPTIAPR